MSPPINPTHLDTNRLPPIIPDEASREKVRLALKKVIKFLDSPKGEDFPQTSTNFQWYELEEFEAYGLLEYLIGWAYLVNVQFNYTELTPAATCQSLEGPLRSSFLSRFKASWDPKYDN